MNITEKEENNSHDLLVQATAISAARKDGNPA